MIAVLSDIHGNPFSLSAVLEDIERYQPERIISLGDILSGPDVVQAPVFCLRSDPRPSWISVNNGEIEIHRIHYDMTGVIECIRRSENLFPDVEAYIEMMQTGRHWYEIVVSRTAKKVGR